MDLGKRVGHTKRPRQIAEPRPQIALPPAPAAAGLSPLAFFVRDSVNNAPGQMPKAAGGGNITASAPLPTEVSMVAGWALELTASVTGSVGANTWTGELNVVRGGGTTPTGIKVQVTGTTVTPTPGRFALQPRDQLIVLDSKSGALNAEGIDVAVWGRLESRPAGAMA